MRKELILEDAGPQLDVWRETFVDNLATQLPKAVVLPIEHTIEISRRGQRVWIALNKRNSNDVRVVTATRSTLIPLAIVFFIIGAFYLVGCVASYMSYWYYYIYSSNYYLISPYYYILPYIPAIVLFFGLGLALVLTNKTRKMQTIALQLARDVWFALNRRLAERAFPRSVPQSTPPKILVSLDRTVGNYCMYCGTHVEKTGAKFCESCGKSLFI